MGVVQENKQYDGFDNQWKVVNENIRHTVAGAITKYFTAGDLREYHPMG